MGVSGLQLKKLTISAALLGAAFLLMQGAVSYAGALNNLMRAFTEPQDFDGEGTASITVDNINSNTGNPFLINQTRTNLTASAAVGATSLTVTSSAGFSTVAPNREILIVQILGGNIGTYEFKIVSAIPNGTTITVSTPLKKAYTAGGANRVQVLKVEHYINVTVNSGGLMSVPVWDGTTGGVMAFRTTGNLTIADASGTGVTCGCIGCSAFGGACNTVAGTVGPGYNLYAAGGTTTPRGYLGGVAGGGNGTGPGGGVGLWGGATDKTAGSPYFGLMGSGGGGGAALPGKAGGGLMIIKVGGTLTMTSGVAPKARFTLVGGPGTVDAGAGAGGTAIISATTISGSAGSCGDIKVDGGVGGGGPAAQNGRAFLLWRTTFDQNCRTSINFNGTYQKFYIGN